MAFRFRRFKHGKCLVSTISLQDGQNVWREGVEAKTARRLSQLQRPVARNTDAGVILPAAQGAQVSSLLLATDH